MTDDHDATSRPYDPTEPEPPAREPPRRRTAPQSDYTTRQVGIGIAVAVVGFLIVFGLPLALA